MKRRINPLIIIYLIVVYLPIAVVTTVICATLTCLMIPIWGDSRWGYYPGMVWARILCRAALVRVRVEGREWIDPGRSYIFAANHQSIFDIFLVYGWLGVKFRWIMKKELRRIPFVGRACEMMGHIFIDRSNPKAARRSLLAAEQRLRHGTSVFIFPEGTRTKDGSVGPLKRGAFFIARDLSLPIVPVTISGAYEVMPYHAAYISPGTIRLTIHAPVAPDGLADPQLPETIRAIRHTIESAL